jgi:putative holliday junction resolvase
MRILGIDYGDRHIGLAVSDALGLTAQPLPTYTLKAADSENRKFFKDLAARLELDTIVLGYPLRMDGSSGTRAQKTREFAGWLEGCVHLPIVYWDERLTTQQAAHIMQGHKVRGKRKDREDQLAAVIILSTYLESNRDNSDVP